MQLLTRREGLPTGSDWARIPVSANLVTQEDTMGPDTYFHAGSKTYFHALYPLHAQGIPAAAMLAMLAVLLLTAALCGRAVQHRAAARQD